VGWFDEVPLGRGGTAGFFGAGGFRGFGEAALLRGVGGGFGEGGGAFLGGAFGV
jgi:hypothetical protein